MKKFIKDLFKGQEEWRLDSFIAKLEDFRRNCSTNEQEIFIRAGLFIAKQLKLEYAQSLNSSKTIES